jgi:hypothetical protein
MKHRNLFFLQTIIALFFSASMILGTAGTGILGSLPSEYSYNAYAQEVCEWYDPTCVGDFVGDDDAATTSPAETPAETPAVQSTQCDPVQSYCYPTDVIVDSSGQVICDGTQADCSAYSGEPPTSSEVGAGTCDPSIAICPEQGYTDPVVIPDGPDTETGQRVEVTKQECSTITHTSDAKGKACRALCWSVGAGCAAAACAPPHGLLTCVGVGMVCGGLASVCSDSCTEDFPPETTTETVCNENVPNS